METENLTRSTVGVTDLKVVGNEKGGGAEKVANG
jgi:hypothetical protein